MSDDEDCPGKGKCHGCVCWCNRCGDVDLTCDSVQGDCSRHHCYSCKQLLGKDDFNGDNWSALCQQCSTTAINDDQRKAFEKALDEKNFVLADLIAADIYINTDHIPRPLRRGIPARI